MKAMPGGRAIGSQAGSQAPTGREVMVRNTPLTRVRENQFTTALALVSKWFGPTTCASAAGACGAAARPRSRAYLARLRRANAMVSSKRGLGARGTEAGAMQTMKLDPL